MFCKKCGTEIEDLCKFCPACGVAVDAPVVIVHDGLSVLIPRNAYALWSYYLGIGALLSFVPFVGTLLWLLSGLPAIICGIKGLGYAKLHPESCGVIHCWVGIILGAFNLIPALLWIGMVIVMSL